MGDDQFEILRFANYIIFSADAEKSFVDWHSTIGSGIGAFGHEIWEEDVNSHQEHKPNKICQDSIKPSLDFDMLLSISYRFLSL
jgi:hypothetical protein